MVARGMPCTANAIWTLSCSSSSNLIKSYYHEIYKSENTNIQNMSKSQTFHLQLKKLKQFRMERWVETKTGFSQCGFVSCCFSSISIWRNLVFWSLIFNDFVCNMVSNHTAFNVTEIYSHTYCGVCVIFSENRLLISGRITQ